MHSLHTDRLKFEKQAAASNGLASRMGFEFPDLDLGEN